jgi:hypothetical protein
LTSTNSTTISNVADVFKALATTAGQLGTLTLGLKTAAAVSELAQMMVIIASCLMCLILAEKLAV